jgi:hypothetical protein
MAQELVGRCLPGIAKRVLAFASDHLPVVARLRAAAP